MKGQRPARGAIGLLSFGRYILEELARSFEWGHLSSEQEVNAILKRFHEDAATLRRELIDEQIMMRERGRYWLVRHSQDEQ